jgi:hypothetical protein
LTRGLAAPQIADALLAEGIAAGKRSSVERLVRKDCDAILEELPPLTAAKASPLALAKYVSRNEEMLRKLVEEFDQKEGITETVITYPNGKKMKIERRADRGGQRIRAADLALKCADTLARVEGIAALIDPKNLVDPDGSNNGAAARPVGLILSPPSPKGMSAEQRTRMAALFRDRGEESIAVIYETFEAESLGVETGSEAKRPKRRTDDE